MPWPACVGAGLHLHAQSRFRGQDQFSVNYDGIWDDAGARMSIGKDVVIDVR